MVIAVSKTWKIKSLDISSGFLQGDILDREVFLKPPADVCEPSHIWKLKRCIYGLNDAPRSWYKKVKNEMVCLGGKMSQYDPALFMWYKDNSLCGILVVHVDDFFFCGIEEFHNQVISKIKKKFLISTEASCAFKYLGLAVSQIENEIEVNQNDYINTLKLVEIQRDNLNDRILDEDEKSKLRSISGQVAWVASQTRPDVSFDSCRIANRGKNPDIQLLKEANKSIRKMKNCEVTLKICNIGDLKKAEILCYTDATHASLKCGASQGAYIILLHGNGKVIPITWQSKKVSRVTKSPLASETLALGEGADASYLLASLLKEILVLEEIPKIKCVTDSKSLYDTLRTTNVTKDLRLRVDIARLREKIEKEEIDVSWVEGKYQLADSMTKGTASPNRLLDVLEYSTLMKTEQFYLL